MAWSVVRVPSAVTITLMARSSITIITELVQNMSTSKAARNPILILLILLTILTIVIRVSCSP